MVFVLGTSFSAYMAKEYAAMHVELSFGEVVPLKVYLLTHAQTGCRSCLTPSTRRIVRHFHVPCRIIRDNTRSLNGIGGTTEPIGTVTIPVPFRDLNLVIDVTFQIVESNVPKVLSMGDIHDNGLDISIQENVVRYKLLMHCGKQVAQTRRP